MGKSKAKVAICRQMELFQDDPVFVGAGIDSPGQPQDPAFMRALAFFEENLLTVEVGGQKRKGYSHSDLWEFLGKPYGEKRIRRWWSEKKDFLKLKRGKNFWEFRHTRVPKLGRGRKENSFLISPAVAREIVGTDPRDGKTYREALWQLAHRYRDSDPEMIREMLERTEDPAKIEQIVNLSQKRFITYYRRRGMSWEWIHVRLRGKVNRNILTEYWAEREVKQNGYAEITNAMYRAQYDKDASDFRRERSVPRGKPARDGMTMVELAKVNLSECLSIEAMESDPSIVGTPACKKVCVRQAEQLKDIRPK